MQNFNFYNPTRVIFGKGGTGRIGEATAPYGRRVLLLYGRGSAERTGLLKKVRDSLFAAGIEWVERGGVKPNPVLSFARETIDIFRAEKLEAIVAVGGGSVIDTAKTVAAGARYDGDVWDFFCGKARVRDAAPVTVVLTLAAAASEMNCGGVITNEETCQKFHLVGEPLYPRASILDPENTFTVPRDQSMFGAVDAIIHLLEGYFNCVDTAAPIQDRITESLVRTILETAPVVFREPENYTARADLMWCATLALNGIASAGIGPTGFPMHMIGHSLSALYDIAHGASLSIVAPAWMRYKSASEPRKFARFAASVFGIDEGSESERASGGIHALESAFASMQVPVKLQQAGIALSDTERIAGNARMTAVEWGLEAYTPEVISDILELAC